MSYFLLMWRSLWKKPLQTVIATTIIGSSVGLLILVLLLTTGIKQGLVRATEPFDLIVGAKGSPFQLTLNTVFLQDKPIGNIDYAWVQKLAADPAVKEAIPLAFGDNYRGHRIIGTEPGLFRHSAKNDGEAWLKLAAGRVFQDTFEAVIGSKAAKDSGLVLGDKLISSHGLIGALEGVGKEHAEKAFTVVGILDKVSGPYDDAVFVPIRSIWELHEHGEHEEEPVSGRSPASLKAAATEEHELEEEEHALTDEHNHKETTVILVKPTGYAQAMTLYKEFQKNKDVQLIFPSQNVIQLLQILGEGEKIFQVITYAVLFIVLAIIGLSIYWSNLNKVRDRIILRALGAGQGLLARLAFGEGQFQIVLGIICGFLAGHGIYAVLISFLQQKTALAFPHEITLIEIAALGIILVLGSLISLLCAWGLYHSKITDEI